MSLKLNRQTGQWEDGTGNLDEKFRRKNQAQWLVLLLSLGAMIFFPTESAKVIMTIGLMGILTGITLWMFGFSWGPKG